MADPDTRAHLIAWFVVALLIALVFALFWLSGMLGGRHHV